MFQGVYTALITPFLEGKVDEKAFEKIINFQIENGVHGLVPCGTTGESPTLDYKEHDRVVELVVEVASKRVPVIAGTGSNSTSEAIIISNHAEKVGADAILIVTPYYNKPNQEGLYQHFKAINDNCGLPIIIYNIPGRSVINMSIETMKRLSELKNIVGVKDATSDLSLPISVRREIGANFCQLSGEDGTALPFNIAGGSGCISVAANVIPRLCADLQNYSLSGEFAKAQEIQFKISELNELLFCDTNPIAVKYAMYLLGLCSMEIRLPLIQLSDDKKLLVKNAMASLGLI